LASEQQNKFMLPRAFYGPTKTRIWWFEKLLGGRTFRSANRAHDLGWFFIEKTQQKDPVPTSRNPGMSIKAETPSSYTLFWFFINSQRADSLLHGAICFCSRLPSTKRLRSKLGRFPTASYDFSFFESVFEAEGKRHKGTQIDHNLSRKKSFSRLMPTSAFISLPLVEFSDHFTSTS
jgi:hypothetical protein